MCQKCVKNASKMRRTPFGGEHLFDDTDLRTGFLPPNNARSKDRVFLDSDELDELGGLLDVVGRQTKNLVILLSSA